jgi:hypothetical protein
MLSIPQNSCNYFGVFYFIEMQGKVKNELFLPKF